MSAITFDTLKFVERLEQAGMPRVQAIALAEVQKDTFAEALDSTLSTKADITRLEKTVGQDITRLEKSITHLEGEMNTLKWMTGVLIALAIANFAKQFF